MGTEAAQSRSPAFSSSSSAEGFISSFLSDLPASSGFIKESIDILNEKNMLMQPVSVSHGQYLSDFGT